MQIVQAEEVEPIVAGLFGGADFSIVPMRYVPM